MSKAPVAPEENNEGTSLDFIRTIIAEDCESGKYEGRVHTRFPPEPNGYLHLGHAKSICLNFGIAQEHEGGICNLRFDDTNPLKEEDEYVQSIQEDVKWLGFDWGEKPFYTSNYFEVLFGHAVKLIEMGKAYVDHSTPEAIREMRGTLTEPGTYSPFRSRSVEENLDLFNRMRNGEFADGECVLRAKIDMTSPNMIMRDPALYRIRRATHHRTGDTWCIYPMYDFAHCLSDSQEHITHSICTLEFENNRELYDWLLETLGVYRPQQIEFARLNMTHTVLSKRKLIQLVEEGHVHGWDDPRMPTISGLRRRGCPPEAIREFCSRIGVAKADSMVDAAMLEFCMREKLNAVVPRLMGVVDPVKVVITNYPEDQVDEFDMPLHPELEEYGKRIVPFSRELYIERADFREEAPNKKFFRLAIGKEVRLRYAYYITATDVVKDENGEIVEIHCTYDPETKGGWSEDGRKVKGTLHWVSVKHAVPTEVRLYEPLFEKENPNKVEEDKTFIDYINPDSEKIITAYVEPRLAECKAGERVQFERLGYYCADLDMTAEKAVFNRTATLRDSWKRVERNQK